jgi:hypothetical protein
MRFLCKKICISRKKVVPLQPNLTFQKDNSTNIMSFLFDKYIVN